MLHIMVYIGTRTKSKDKRRSMQKLYTTTLSLCKHEFQVGVHSKSSGILPVTGLFETAVVLEEVQLSYSRRSKKLPIDSFSKYLSNWI